MNRKQRRMFTASAAASLVLTVGPALVAPPGAAAGGIAGVIAPARASLLASSVALSRSAFRQTVRAARAELRQADSAATTKYRLAVSPVHRTMMEAVAAAPTESARRTIRQSYGEAILADRLELDQRLLEAHQDYVVRVEQARVSYLRSVGADPAAVAQTRARTAAHTATAAYQVAVLRARSIHRSVTAPSRATLRAALPRPELSADEAVLARTTAQRAFREAAADATAFFRASLGLASEEYRKSLAKARSDYGAAVSSVNV